MLILGIESSCDETSASVVENGTRVKSCIIASSQRDFETIGGVIPEEAARRQLQSMLPVIEESLKKAGIVPADLDAIAVTHGPGLLGSLLVGTTTARVLSLIWKKPLIPVHHTLGHLSSTWLEQSDVPEFPLLTLSVSGGHTDLWYRKSHISGELIGSTLDDAAGEAFDKGAKLLGLPYPGGPALSALAEQGKREAYEFPLPLGKKDPLMFSFSGLKTSLKYLLRDLGEKRTSVDSVRSSIAASFEKAITDHLIDRLRHAVIAYPEAKEIHIVGGVSANRCLRQCAEQLGSERGRRMRFPSSLRYCTDNAAMIAAAGYFSVSERPELLSKAFFTVGSLSLLDAVQR